MIFIVTNIIITFANEPINFSDEESLSLEPDYQKT